MASSKKPVSSKSKPTKSKASETKIEDAVVIEEVTSSDGPLDVSKDKIAEMPKTKTTKADVPKTDAKKADAAQPDIAPEKETRSTDKEPKAQPEPIAAAVIPVTRSEPTPEKQSIFLPLVLGGIVAGALGFMASEFDVFGSDDAALSTQLRNDLNTQQERLAALESAKPAAAEASVVDLSPIETRLSDIETRIVALEERPVIAAPSGMDGEAAAAYAAELEALKASAETQRNEIAALLSNAQSVEQATAEAAKAASVQAAIAKIISAIDSGQPFADAVADLKALDLGEIDPALVASAESGVATLSTLQSEFPDQARTALATARASGVEEGQQGLGGFLKRSLGARSVAPREGNDPDAVLSRAEAAIKTGDLTTTLTELDTLPEEAQAAIVDWRAAADARVAARNAADALAQRLTAD